MKKDNNIILFGIILVAITLRLISPLSIPFTHDEFSALFRTHYLTFSELIEYGVKPDGHPAGVQVFLFYWTKLFGYSEIVVKLPFIIFGIISVFLIYKIAQKWYNSTVGLVCASFVATLQYTVMYSQIARPYISGLFFSLLMVYYWQKIVFEPQKKFYLHGLIYIVASSLCAYNHYFSLLFAMIVGLTGLFLINKKYILKYILFGFAIFLTFIPHLPIFIFQLKQGGVEGWLGKPQNDFLLEYIKYVFHFSLFVYALVVGIIILGIIKLKTERPKLKFITISFCWFMMPFLVGFFYSRYFNSVLQYSVLIFSFPFLLLFIFGHLTELTFRGKSIIVTLIILVNVLTLIIERKHYELFYNSVYEQILVQNDTLKKSNTDYISIIDSDKGISKYYTKKRTLDTSFIWFDRFSNIKEFSTYIQHQKSKNLFFGALSGSDPVLVSVIQDYYPNILWQKDYFTGTSYLFSKDGSRLHQKPNFISLMDFEKESSNWSLGNKNNWVDTFSYQGKNSYYMDSTKEWSPSFTARLGDIIDNEHNFIDVSLRVLMVDQPEDVLLVSSLESRGKNIDWRATSFDTYISQETKNNEWIKIHHTIKLSDIYLNHSNIIIKIEVWNKGKKKFFIDNFEVKTRRGNPIVYGLIEKGESFFLD